MSDLRTLLEEFRGTLTDEFHKQLVEAYLNNPSYDSLLAACVANVKSKTDEIERNDNPGDQGIQ